MPSKRWINCRENENANQRVLHELLDAKKQLRDGILYNITLISSTCDRDIDDTCKELCKIQMLRSWALDLIPHNAQVVHSECRELSQTQDQLERRRRATGVLGGQRPVDVTSEAVRNLSTFAVGQMQQKADLDHSTCYTDNVLKATSQVVSGSAYRLDIRVCIVNCDQQQRQKASTECKVCKVEIWVQEWLNRTELTNSSCQSDSEYNSSGRRVKRDLAKLRQQEAEEDASFQQFTVLYNKNYKSEEERQMRRDVFRQNLQKIETLRRHEQGTATYGINFFADLTEDEFRKYLGLKPPPPSSIAQAASTDQGNDLDYDPTMQLPTDFDWRSYNVVSTVKNQGMCGSCWAFSAIGNIEGQWALKKGQLLSLSEQELVDCDKIDAGCGGGYMSSAYDSIQRLGGLETEQQYPYEGKDDKCRFDRQLATVSITGSQNLTSNETALAQWLVRNGPISIGINAFAMQFYFGGVSHPPKLLCEPDGLDHGVLIVGFGIHKTKFTHKEVPYWLIKNSWGPRWGEKGYYRVYRGSGVCGVNRTPSSAVVA